MARGMGRRGQGEPLWPEVVRRSPEAVELRMDGEWRMWGTPRPAAAAVLLRADVHPPQRVTVLAGAVQPWDTSLVAFLLALRRACEERGVDCVLETLPEGVEQLLSLATAVRPRPAVPAGRVPLRLLTDLGLAMPRLAARLMEWLGFGGQAMLAVGRLLGGRAAWQLRDLFTVMLQSGPGSLPVVGLISLLVGMIVAFLAAAQLQWFGAQILIADLVAIGMCREMGALMTGILMAGRMGAAFAAHIGSMQVNDEIDALRTVGIEPMDFLLLPRLIGLVLMLPLLVFFSIWLGILGGGLVGVLLLDLTPAQYATETTSALRLDDLLAGLIKSLVFAVVVACSGCAKGMRSGRTAAAVGEAATAAVVAGILWIVITDSACNIIFLETGL